MLQHNSSDGFGDEFDFAASTQSSENKSSENKPMAWPKSSNWNDRIQLPSALQEELSAWIESSLEELEVTHKDFISPDSQRKSIRQSR